MFGTNKQGGSFDQATVEAVWRKGTPVAGKDPAQWRKDTCGALMLRSAHGDRQHDRGWEIDHIKPVADGGSDDLSNLQPLHWKNNLAKGDGRLVCEVTS
jgi:hypothetical protein